MPGSLRMTCISACSRGLLVILPSLLNHGRDLKLGNWPWKKVVRTSVGARVRRCDILCGPTTVGCPILERDAASAALRFKLLSGPGGQPTSTRARKRMRRSRRHVPAALCSSRFSDSRRERRGGHNNLRRDHPGCRRIAGSSRPRLLEVSCPREDPDEALIASTNRRGDAPRWLTLLLPSPLQCVRCSAVQCVRGTVSI